ncbi:hypothetical protein SDC9_208439 [bioreactor metagenome]|uniref:Uncharacterized protein n=1 Tax=bioreactor metagenome TaxID=1076179 RepID=A0A645JAM9_9ZZZZ
MYEGRNHNETFRQTYGGPCRGGADGTFRRGGGALCGTDARLDLRHRVRVAGVRAGHGGRFALADGIRQNCRGYARGACVKDRQTQ